MARIRLRDGRWFESSEAVRVTDRLWYTRRGTWLFLELAQPVVVDVQEVVQIILSTIGCIEDCPGFDLLPDTAKQRLQDVLDAEYSPGDEV